MAAIESVVREFDRAEFWSLVAVGSVAAALCLVVSTGAFRRFRLLHDLPRSRIRSAAQGYVELSGTARMMPGEPLIAPLSGKPCAWYRFTVEQRGRDPDDERVFAAWSGIESGSSDGIFHLDDGTDRCIVDPDGAEVIPSVSLRWRGRYARPRSCPRRSGNFATLFSRGPYRYSEDRIEDGARIGAVGSFRSIGGSLPSATSHEVAHLLAEWKRDRAGLLQRFDRDGDGQIGMLEWDAAQVAAERAVSEADLHRDHGAVHVLSRPADDRPYLVFAQPPEDFYRRHLQLALLTGGLFVAMSAAVSWLLSVRLALPR